MAATKIYFVYILQNGKWEQYGSPQMGFDEATSLRNAAERSGFTAKATTTPPDEMGNETPPPPSKPAIGLVKFADLNLGDTVRLGSSGFMDAKVKQRTPEKVVLLRAYVSCTDVEYSGGNVIATLGYEELVIYPSDTRFWNRIENGPTIR